MSNELLYSNDGVTLLKTKLLNHTVTQAFYGDPFLAPFPSAFGPHEP